jgi:polar amino acid transport system ATP-binding protein
MAHLEISHLDVRYGTTRVLSGIDLQVARGELVGLVGPSGSGKSTLLRALVGLVAPSAGQVILEGKVVDYANKDSLRTLRNHAAIVFQQYNLFQNMTVLDNITVALLKNEWVTLRDH